MQQRLTLRARDAVDLLILRDAGKAHEHGDHRISREVAQRVFEFPV